MTLLEIQLILHTLEVKASSKIFVDPNDRENNSDIGALIFDELANDVFSGTFVHDGYLYHWAVITND